MLETQLSGTLFKQIIASVLENTYIVSFHYGEV